jgi:outer membrane receptor protein involved in Fe transport
LSNNSTESVDSAGFVNLRTGWESEQDWSLTFYVENLFDKESFAASFLELSMGFHTKVGATMPRTAGVEFMYSF